MALRAVTYFAPVPALAARFYRDVFAFREFEPLLFGNGMRLCDVGLRQGSGAPAVERQWPLVTVAVSNLKTAKRLVGARGGHVVASSDGAGAEAAGGLPLATQLPFDPSRFAWALVRDPAGNPAVLVHKFRRNSVLSFAIQAVDVGRTEGTRGWGGQRGSYPLPSRLRALC